MYDKQKNTMETNATYYIDLITRYFCGEATPEDIRELEAWVKADPANDEFFSSYHKTWKVLGETGSPSADLDREWTKLQATILANTEKAANEPLVIPFQKSKIVNLKSEILSWSLRIAAMFVVLAIPAFFLYHYFVPPAERELVAGNSVTEQVLPDGTSVTLNAGSTLSWPSRFNGKVRNVTLKGEGWFVVSHDAKRPFIITTGDLRIRDIGTSFFVNTKTWGNTQEVILVTGKVEVYFEGRPGRGQFLFPGDKAEALADGRVIEKSVNRDPNFLSWKTKHMEFSNTPLNEVVALLAKIYHVSIRVSDDRMSNCRITATFDNQSLESVLHVLKATLDLQIRNTGAGIELSGHGCN